MLLPARVDDYIDPESPVRVLDAFVDGVELGALGFAQRGHGSRGRSSYDPASLLKLYLWGYLRRCRSSRKLEEACATNLEAIWLTGGIRPDHSTISDFRKRHPRPLKNIFKEFNLACIELGLFGRELVAIDGTFIKAVNSESKSFTRNKLAKLIASIDRATGRYLEMLDSADASEPQVGAGGGEEIRDKIERLKARKLQLEAYQEGCETSPTGQVNLTDPECVHLSKGGKSTVGYNVQMAVDDRHHLVASVEVTQDGNDMAQLSAMSQQAKSDLDLAPDARLKALADAGYATGPELASCEANNTETYVPLPRTKNEKAGLFSVADFTHDPDSDTYRCPAGETLHRGADKHKPGGRTATIYNYHNRRACKGCQLLAKCTRSTFRQLAVSEHKPTTDAVRARLAESPGSMPKRASLAEHPFGTIKELNGRSGLLCRGKQLAGAEMALSFWAYNFTRAINILGVGRLLEAMRQRGAAIAAA